MLRRYAAGRCSEDMQYVYAAWTFSKDMQQGYTIWTCSMAMKPGHDKNRFCWWQPAYLFGLQIRWFCYGLLFSGPSIGELSGPWALLWWWEYIYDGSTSTPWFPQGASVETQQPWRERVLGRLLLLQGHEKPPLKIIVCIRYASLTNVLYISFRKIHHRGALLHALIPCLSRLAEVRSSTFANAIPLTVYIPLIR
jgi:hypothetical protein